ncbi:myb domain-containing protein, partial [Reticulomyxa filosa]
MAKLRICYGDIVELSDGKNGAVKYIGHTDFFPGRTWFVKYVCKNMYVYIFKHVQQYTKKKKKKGNNEPNQIPLNEMVNVNNYGKGRVRFIGQTMFDETGGDKKVKGNSNGSIDNVAYFKCDQQCGVFVRSSQLKPVALNDDNTLTGSIKRTFSSANLMRKKRHKASGSRIRNYVDRDRDKDKDKDKNKEVEAKRDEQNDGLKNANSNNSNNSNNSSDSISQGGFEDNDDYDDDNDSTGRSGFANGSSRQSNPLPNALKRRSLDTVSTPNAKEDKKRGQLDTTDKEDSLKASKHRQHHKSDSVIIIPGSLLFEEGQLTPLDDDNDDNKDDHKTVTKAIPSQPLKATPNVKITNKIN